MSNFRASHFCDISQGCAEKKKGIKCELYGSPWGGQMILS